VTVDILFDHPEFVVIDKPIGISVQNETEQSGILPLVCEQLELEKLWLVHRLDKITSGLLILAKNSSAAAEFGRIFENRQIEKYYLALSKQKPKKKQGTVIGNMKKVRDGKWMLTQETSSPAITQFFSCSLLPGTRLFLLRPYTGKTHQIRVALKSLGSPIIGDLLYARNTSPSEQTADRTYLHAYALKFCFRGEDICLHCRPSLGELFTLSFFDDVVTNYLQPWKLNWPKLPFRLSDKHPTKIQESKV
jgi:tRNA pseudouridine32 synthase/23S rRNA pseudouridine746 synthase